jgi:hypothetical protein
MSAATQCAVLPAASSAAPAARAPRTAARSGLPARDAPPAAAPAVLYAPPRRLRLVASGAPPAVPHEVRSQSAHALADTRIWARAAACSPRAVQRYTAAPRGPACARYAPHSRRPLKAFTRPQLVPQLTETLAFCRSR